MQQKPRFGGVFYGAANPYMTAMLTVWQSEHDVFKRHHTIVLSYYFRMLLR
jgi:hypothetical protein